MGIAKLRGFKYPTRSFVPGSTRIPPPRQRVLSEVLDEWGAAIQAKKQKQNDQRARQSAAHHAKVIADRDLPDPGEVKVVESLAGQKRWQF